MLIPFFVGFSSHCGSPTLERQLSFVLETLACTHLLFPSSILQRVFSISIVLWIKSEWGNCSFYTFISLLQRMVHHVPMYGRLLWLVVRHGYIARSNRVGTRPGVTHRTSMVHCTTKYRQTTSDMMNTRFLIRTFGDVSERGKGACPYTVPSCPPFKSMFAACH